MRKTFLVRRAKKEGVKDRQAKPPAPFKWNPKYEPKPEDTEAIAKLQD